MNRGLSIHVWTLVLIFGVTEAVGAVFWLALAAAGLRATEWPHILAFLLMGPLSALPAAIVALWYPKWGAMWLVAGGLVSGVLAVPYFSTDAGVFPVLLCSLPMLIAGGSLLRVCTNGRSKHNAHAEHRSTPRVQQGEEVPPASPRNSKRDTEVTEHSHGPQPVWDQGSFTVPVTGVLLFLLGWIGTLLLSMVLATFLRDTLLSHKLPHEANAVCLLLLGCVITLMSFMRKPLALRAEFVIGMWIALLSDLVLLNYQ